MSTEVIKTQLIAAVQATRRDAYQFSEYALGAKGENTEKARDRATKACEALDRVVETLRGANIPDTEEAYAIAAAIRESLVDMREDIPSLGGTPRLLKTIKNIEAQASGISMVPEKGRKLSGRHKIEGFKDADETTIGKGECDELSAAVYVLESLNTSDEFLEEMRGMLMPADLPEMPRPFIPAEDAYYQTMQAAIERAVNDGRLARERGDKVTLATCVNAIQNYTKTRDTYVATKQAEVTKAMNEYNRILARSTRKGVYDDLMRNVRDVQRVFTGESLVDYGTRAEIMAENGVRNLADIVREYIAAATRDNRDKMDEIDGLFVSIKESYNTEERLLLQSRDIDSVLPEHEVDFLADQVAMPEMDDAMLDALFGKMDETPVATERESGAVETVNTEAEEKPKENVEDRFADILSQLGGN